jgi:hypothetical protein
MSCKFSANYEQTILHLFFFFFFFSFFFLEQGFIHRCGRPIHTVLSIKPCDLSDWQPRWQRFIIQGVKLWRLFVAICWALSAVRREPWSFLDEEINWVCKEISFFLKSQSSCNSHVYITLSCCMLSKHKSRSCINSAMQNELAKIALPTSGSLHLPILVSLATDEAECDRSDRDVSSLFFPPIIASS